MPSDSEARQIGAYLFSLTMLKILIFVSRVSIIFFVEKNHPLNFEGIKTLLKEKFFKK